MRYFSKEYLRVVIEGTDTKAGKAFDIALIFAIIFSSFLIIIDSVSRIHLLYGDIIVKINGFMLVLFTLEYILRIIISNKRKSYVLSFYGVVDLLAILPLYIGFLFPSSQILGIIRILRLLRLFSILKMGRYVKASRMLITALKASSIKISVFLVVIMFIVIIVGAAMYAIEGSQYGFINIPESMYWAIVTISTVGYGDISPQTEIGKVIASLLMLVGYAIIAVPTGIISSEITAASAKKRVGSEIEHCPECGENRFPFNAKFCSNCGLNYE